MSQKLGSGRVGRVVLPNICVLGPVCIISYDVRTVSCYTRRVLC